MKTAITLRIKLILSILLLCSPVVSYSSLLTHPGEFAEPNKNAYALYLGSSSTDYAINKSKTTAGIGRSLIGGNISRDLYKGINGFLSLAYVFDADDGTGQIFAFGAKGQLPFAPKNDFTFNWHTQYSINNEELGEVNQVTVENTLSEILIGLSAQRRFSDDLSLYAGIELVASSSGQAVWSKANIDDFKSDFERDSGVGLIMGISYKSLQMHIGLGHEQSFLIGTSLPFQPIKLSKLINNNDQTEIMPEPVIAPEVKQESQPALKEKEDELNKSSLSRKQRKLQQLQSKLNAIGYKLTADGLMGKNTRRAIRQYQKDVGLTVTGKDTISTYESLGLE